VGIVLFFVAFALPTWAARTEKVSKLVARLEVLDASAATGLNGLALVNGTLSASSLLTPPKGDAKNLLAYRYQTADMETHLETHQETHTEVRNGQDVEVTEEVTEEVTDWVTKVDDERFASGWQVGAIRIDPQRASLDLQWEQVYHEDNGKHRESVEVLRPGGMVLLAAELNNGQVAEQPKLYKLTSKNKAELVAEMNVGEEAGRWGLLIVSVIVWTISLNLLIGPAMILINIIPIQQIGGALRGMITFISFLVACTLAWFTYTLVKYWWLIALLLLVLTVVVILNARNRQAQPDLDTPPDEPAPASS
jgi:hypothetical protein